MTTHAVSLSLFAAIGLTAATGCKKDPPATTDQSPAVTWPTLTASKLPGPATGLAIGVTSETDAHDMWQGLTRDADESLGGKGMIRHNNAPAAHWHGPSGKGTADLWFTGDPLRLHSFEITETGKDLCKWVEDTGGPGARGRGCPGTNRVMGAGKGGYAFCGSTPEGKPVLVECSSSARGETLSVTER